MNHIPRLYESMLSEHLKKNRQMAFVSGSRQVGKTTVAKRLSSSYQNWDAKRFRDAVLAGEEAVAELTGIHMLADLPPVLAFDEIHKFPKWKSFLKGFFDLHGEKAKIIVTGSARMDVFRRGGDSLMGRYFRYRMHPFSVGEIACPSLRGKEPVRPPTNIADADWEALQVHGGFPEPYVRRNATFLRRWNALRKEQLLREDVRDLTRVFEVEQIFILASILENRSGDPLVYASLARDVQASENTIRNWVSILNSLHFGFSVKPWHRNVENAIRKTPKWYLRDWSGIEDAGSRNETLVACHLLKAVECWTDIGIGDFDLHYIRDKQKREVDFLVTRDRKPWFIVEAKTSDTHLSSALARMQSATGARHAFQVVMNLPFVEADCFGATQPVIVPARTFLSQLP